MELLQIKFESELKRNEILSIFSNCDKSKFQLENKYNQQKVVAKITICSESQMDQSFENITIKISTKSSENISIEIVANLIEDFALKIGETRSGIIIDEYSPVYWLLQFNDTNEYMEVKIFSEDDHCMYVFTEEAKCSINNLNPHLETVLKKTITKTVSIPIKKYSHNKNNALFIVFILADDNICRRNSNNQKFSENFRRKSFNFTFVNIDTDYLKPGQRLFWIIFMIGFFHASVYFVSVFKFPCWSYQIDKDNLENGNKNITKIKDNLENGNKNITKIIDNIQIKKAKSMQRRYAYCMECCYLKFWNFEYFLPSKYILIISIFYILPTVQLLYYYIKVMNDHGNFDLCFYNDLCSKPYKGLMAFNNVFSNIGYMIMGFFFIVIVAIRHRVRKQKKNLFISPNYGIFYALGLSLIIEGILSGIYHICPRSDTIQFDATFMYIIGCLLTLYYSMQLMRKFETYSKDNTITIISKDNIIEINSKENTLTIKSKKINGRTNSKDFTLAFHSKDNNETNNSNDNNETINANTNNETITANTNNETNNSNDDIEIINANTNNETNNLKDDIETINSKNYFITINSKNNTGTIKTENNIKMFNSKNYTITIDSCDNTMRITSEYNDGINNQGNLTTANNSKYNTTINSKNYALTFDSKENTSNSTDNPRTIISEDNIVTINSENNTLTVFPKENTENSDSKNNAETIKSEDNTITIDSTYDCITINVKDNIAIINSKDSIITKYDDVKIREMFCYMSILILTIIFILVFESNESKKIIWTFIAIFQIVVVSLYCCRIFIFCQKNIAYSFGWRIFSIILIAIVNIIMFTIGVNFFSCYFYFLSAIIANFLTLAIEFYCITFKIIEKIKKVLDWFRKLSFQSINGPPKKILSINCPPKICSQNTCSVFTIIVKIFYIVLNLCAALSLTRIALLAFEQAPTEWGTTASLSRIKNQDCIWDEFYDIHDIWHILSSLALFHIYMFIFLMDGWIYEKEKQNNKENTKEKSEFITFMFVLFVTVSIIVVCYSGRWFVI